MNHIKGGHGTIPGFQAGQCWEASCCYWQHQGGSSLAFAVLGKKGVAGSAPILAKTTLPSSQCQVAMLFLPHQHQYHLLWFCHMTGPKPAQLVAEMKALVHFKNGIMHPLKKPAPDLASHETTKVAVK